MKKIYLSIGIILLFILSACGQQVEQEYASENESELEEDKLLAAEEVDQVKEDVPKKEDELENMSVEEIQSIVNNTFISLNEEMEVIQSNYPEWMLADWIDHPDNDEEGYAIAYDITSKVYTDLVTEKVMDEIVYSYLATYFCQCDINWMLGESGIRFEVLEQSSDKFIVSSLSLAHPRSTHEPAGRNIFEFVKEDGLWKYNGNEFVSAAEKPLNLTYGDLKHIQFNYETGEVIESEFIDVVEFEGEDYIVIKYGDFYEARNTKSSEINYELQDQFANKESVAEETIEDLDSDVIVEKEVAIEIAEDEINELDNTLSSKGILTEEQDIQLYKLVNNNYQYFVKNMQEYRVYETDEDIFGTIVEGAVPHNYTIHEALIAFDDDGNTYAAILIDGEIIKYYTTDIRYVNELPGEFVIWKGRFSSVPIEKYYIERH